MGGSSQRKDSGPKGAEKDFLGDFLEQLWINH